MSKNEVKPSIHSGYHEIRMPAYTGQEDYHARFKAGVREATTMKVTRLFIDATSLKAPIPIMDLYDMGEAMQKLLAGKDISRIAVLVRKETAHPDAFFESVVRNRGINFRDFFDRNEAIAWLQSDDPA